MSDARLGRAAELAERRVRLRAQCALERRQLAAHAAEIEHKLSRIDRSVAIARRWIRKPALVVAAVAALTLIGPARALRWVSRGAMWYGVAKRALGAYSAFRSERARLPIDA